MCVCVHKCVCTSSLYWGELNSLETEVASIFSIHGHEDDKDDPCTAPRTNTNTPTETHTHIHDHTYDMNCGLHEFYTTNEQYAFKKRLLKTKRRRKAHISCGCKFLKQKCNSERLWEANAKGQDFTPEPVQTTLTSNEHKPDTKNHKEQKVN